MKKHKMMLKVMLEKLVDLYKILELDTLSPENRRCIWEAVYSINDILWNLNYVHVNYDDVHEIRDCYEEEIIIRYEEA